MVKRIIHPNVGGGVSVVICHDADDNPLSDLSLEEIAKSVVPLRVPFRFVNSSEIPPDRDNRAGWSADFSTPDGLGEAVPFKTEMSRPDRKSDFMPGAIFLRPKGSSL
jgi:hypothetical protein